MRAKQKLPLFLGILGSISVGLIAVAPFAALVIGSNYLQRSLCPQDSLVAGHLVGILFAIGSLLLWVAVSVFLLYGIRWRGRRAGFWSPAAVRSMCIVIAIPALLAWLDGLFTYYCVTPQAIIVHPDPLLEPVAYSWRDVVRLEVGCTHGRSTSVLFDLHLKDGRRLGLGGDSWTMTLANYESVIAALSAATYVYDNERLKGCPPDYWRRFANRPG